MECPNSDLPKRNVAASKLIGSTIKVVLKTKCSRPTTTRKRTISLFSPTLTKTMADPLVVAKRRAAKGAAVNASPQKAYLEGKISDRTKTTSILTPTPTTQPAMACLRTEQHGTEVQMGLSAICRPS